jgi:hypothetical protein
MKIILALLIVVGLSSCTLDSVTVSTGHIPSYYKVSRPIYRTYYYDLRPDYIRYRYGRPRKIYYRH